MKILLATTTTEAIQENPKAYERRSCLKWLPLEILIPNPLNPRKDMRVEVERMIEIIKTRGWEETITAYPQNAFYVILSGHRRWMAARELKLKEVPVHIVEPPKDDKEALERIASLQMAHEEWSKFEWAKLTYNAWEKMGKPNYSAFGRLIGLSNDTVRKYITIFEFYQDEDIESKFNRGVYNVESLYRLAMWIQKLQKHHPQLIKDITPQYIRKVMLTKLEKRRLSYKHLTGDRFVEVGTDRQIMDYLVDPYMTLRQAQELAGVVDKEEPWNIRLQKISRFTSQMEYITPQTKNQAEALEKWLELLTVEINRKLKLLDNMKWNDENRRTGDEIDVLIHGESFI